MSSVCHKPGADGNPQIRMGSLFQAPGDRGRSLSGSEFLAEASEIVERVVGETGLARGR